MSDIASNRKGFSFSPTRILLLILCWLVLLDTFKRVDCVSVVSLGAEVICGRVPGLTARQREMCRAAPDAMVAVGDGVSLATSECRYQFKNHRWNCTNIASPSSFGHVVVVASREAAFIYAISSAGVTYSVTAACARGNISACGCAPSPRYRDDHSGWKWGGCSADVAFGMRLARKFLDAREIEGDARSLMNLHNNKAGRKAVKMALQTECKCHGVSGSCTMKTCWRTLPPFRVIGDNIMKKYMKARPVSAGPTALEPGISNTATNGAESRQLHPVRGKLQLLLRKSRGIARAPKRNELVFLQGSPNYCERDLAAGSFGTVGRQCNRTSKGTDGCDLMCCGRGYNTHQLTKTWQCRCRFQWCCQVHCDTCSERTEEYTCK